MFFQHVADLNEVFLRFRKSGRHFLQRPRISPVGADIFPLGFPEEFAADLLLPGNRIPGEGHTGAGMLVLVSEDHGLNRDGDTQILRYPACFLPLPDFRGLPAVEAGDNGVHQLGLRILGNEPAVIGTANQFLIGLHQTLLIFF